MKQNKPLHRLTAAAIAAACIFAAAYSIKIPTPTGYLHIADAVIFLTAALLPQPYAAAAAALGAGLSDLVAGYPLWVPFTVLIKGAMTLCFTAHSSRFLCLRNGLALAAASAVNILGYYLGAAVITHSLLAPLPQILTNFLQSAVSALLFVLLALFLDRRGFRKDSL